MTITLTIDPSEIVDVLWQHGDGEITPRSYSGRAMYGTRCLGFDCADLGQIVDLIGKLSYEAGLRDGSQGNAGHDEAAALGEALRNASMRTDEMGRGIIVYWPSIELNPEQAAELDACADEYGFDNGEEW
jgi:hypothetical protein